MYLCFVCCYLCNSVTYLFKSSLADTVVYNAQSLPVIFKNAKDVGPFGGTVVVHLVVDHLLMARKKKVKNQIK